MVELPVVTLGCVAFLLLASLAGLADLTLWDDIRPSAHFGGGHAGPKPAPLGLKADDEPEPSSVLVTGVAGFVGFSLAKRLLEVSAGLAVLPFGHPSHISHSPMAHEIAALTPGIVRRCNVAGCPSNYIVQPECTRRRTGDSGGPRWLVLTTSTRTTTYSS